MTNRLFIVFLICFFALTIYGQKQKDVINDFSVVLHEEAINKVKVRHAQKAKND